MSSPESESASPEGGSRIGSIVSGRYKIQQLLGEGGMGAVYLAEHTHMKKRVALKLLHPEMSSNAEVSARFEREAMAAAHIEHPNVAAATDFGKTEDGAFFLVLEYVEGESLRDVVGAGPLAPFRAIRIARQIALALERAHDAGIVHRDLKPENVMLVRRGDDPDFVKVLDFGIAKLSAETIAERGGGNQPLTRLGTILGTPEYMAPEQALGEAVTPQADLYAVGIMLYEMLTGLHPFDPPDRVAMLSFHIVAPVPTMRDRAPAVDVPAPLEAVVRRLLEKDKKARPPSARALVEALESAAAASGIDLALGSPGTPDSFARPLASPQSVAGPDSVTSAPRWTNPDAFAKTSLGDEAVARPAVTSPAITSSGSGNAGGAGGAGAQGGQTSALERVSRAVTKLPRNALYALAAGIPLALVLVVALLIVAFRKPHDDATGGGGAEGTSGAGGGKAGEAAPKIKVAPPARLEAAAAAGPDALVALGAEFPEDAAVKRELALAYHAQGKGAEAMAALRTLLAQDAKAARDDELLQMVQATAARGQGSADDEAFALLEGPLGERGVDVLVELAAKGNTPATRTRATKSLAKPEVRAHASPAASVLLDFKSATSCTAKRDLLPRVKESGDARMLPSLKTLKSTRGCGFLGRGDCWSCMRRDGALEEAASAVESRSPAR